MVESGGWYLSMAVRIEDATPPLCDMDASLSTTGNIALYQCVDFRENINCEMMNESLSLDSYCRDYCV